MENGILPNSVIDKVKEVVIPYYQKKHTKHKGFINEISAFSENDWKLFLANINWQFNLHGNQELSEVLKIKCREIIKQINSTFPTYNGFETTVIYKLRDLLERKLEENHHLSDFEFKDFENIVLNEAVIRTSKTQRNYGKFKKIEDHKFSVEFDNFYFTNYETLIIDEITTQFLHSKSRNFILLTGKSAQGKTILSRQIAAELEKQDYLTLFIELNSRISFQDLNLEEISRENSLVFCLITKSHINLGLINDILLYQERYRNIKFIFESRIIDRTLEHDAKELLNNDILEERKLEFKNYIDFKEKYLGILRKYTSVDIDVNQLIKATGRNFLFLTEYLKSVDISNLSGINYSSIDELVQQKYIERKYNSLKEYAIINQYEIPIKYESCIDKSNFSELVKENELICIDFKKDYYNLYHSAFANLIAKSFYINKGFNDFQILEYEIRVFTNYIIQNNFNECLTIFKSLYTNSGKSLLKSLLTDQTLKSKIIKYYSNPDNFAFEVSSSKAIRDLLKITSEICPEAISEYLQEIIIDNERLKIFFINDDSYILTLINISTYIDKYLPAKFDVFNNNIHEYCSNSTNNLPFLALAYYFNEAEKYNSTLLNILMEKYSLNYLKKVSNKEEFLRLTEGVILLEKSGVHDDFIEIIKNELIAKSQTTTIDRFAKGLQNINRITTIQFSTEIFDKYPKEMLVSGLQHSDFKNALKTANVLKTFGYDKIHKSFNLQNINGRFREYNFTEISNILLEANSFLNNKKLSTELINNIDETLFLEKIKKSTAYKVAQGVQLLHNRWVYKEYIENLLCKTPTSFFKYPKDYNDFFKIVESLHWLNLVNRTGGYAKKCLEQNNEIIDNFEYESLSFERLILIFTYLKDVDLAKTKILIDRSRGIIKEKAKTAKYKEIGLSLSRLANISSNLSRELVSEIIKSSEFLEFLKSQKIHIISRTLKEFHNPDNGTENVLVNELYLKLNKEVISNSLENIKFGMICHSLNELLSIESSDYKRTRKLVWEIGVAPFMAAIEITSFIEICVGFVTLFKINRNFTSELLNKAYSSICIVASLSELDKLSDGLKAFESFNPLFAKEIYNSPNISLNSLARETNNYSLDKIKRCLYFLKSIDKPRTIELLKEFDTQSLLFKFEKDIHFDKAAEILNQLHLIEPTKIESVVKTLDQNDVFNKCIALEFKFSIKGLSDISKIDKQFAYDIFVKVCDEKDILKEISLLEFDVFGKVIREISKIELKPVLSKNILSRIDVYNTAKKATRMSAKLLSLGFGALKLVDLKFSIEVANKLIQLKPKLKGTLKGIKDLIE